MHKYKGIFLLVGIKANQLFFLKQFLRANGFLLNRIVDRDSLVVFGGNHRVFNYYVLETTGFVNSDLILSAIDCLKGIGNFIYIGEFVNNKIIVTEQFKSDIVVFGSAIDMINKLSFGVPLVIHTLERILLKSVYSIVHK